MSTKDKSYRFEVNRRHFQVSAQNEGDCRWMVRMSELGMDGKAILSRTNLRIGYLTGRGRNWLAEFFGSHPSVAAKTAKSACLALAVWAETKPGFAPKEARR